jgi:phosphatidylglycerophosphatase A
MSLDISDALSDGLSRTVERNGLLLMAVFLVFGVINTVSGQTLSAAATRFARRTLEQLPPGATTGPTTLPTAAQTPLALPVPLPVALALVLLVALVAEAIRIVAVRTLVSDETETVPEEFVSRNIVMATLNGFVGGVVVLILVAVGLLLFVVPGIFLALSFFFVRQEIAVEDRNFVEALSASWELTSGNRLSLFALALVLVVIGLVVSAVVGSLVALAGVSILTTIVTVVVSAVTTVFSIAVACRAYVQLASDDDPVLDDEDEWDVQV